MYIKRFSELSKNNVSIAGGKGASLGEMYNAGIHVPNGFVVLSNTFKTYLENNNIYDRINKILKSVDREDSLNLEETSKKIKELILNGKITNEVKEDVLNAFDGLDTRFVAVRSSATSEDGIESAWAGQLESYLNIERDSLLDNIKKCWASLFNPRAILYRIKKNDTSEISVAVVVQQMVESEVSGVAFSVNPTNNNRDEIVIEAVYGLGEAIVSGSVNPDNFVVHRTTNLINKIVNNQSKKLVKNDNNENVWVNLDPSIASMQKMEDKYILELSKTVINIEDYYGFPVDVEWAIKNEELFILQCRPITTVESNDNLNKIIHNIKSSGDWVFYVSRRFNFFTWNSYIIASGEECQNKVLGFNVATKNNLVLNGDEYCKETDSEEKCEILSQKFESNNNFFEEFAKKEFDIVDRANSYIEKLKTIHFSKLSNDELLKELLEFNDIYLETCVTGYTRPDDYLELELKEQLKKEFGDDKEKQEYVFKRLAVVPDYKPLAYSEEPLDLLKLAKTIKEDSSNLEKLLDTHMEKYSWMKAPVFTVDTCFEKEEYLMRLKFLENENIDEKIANILNVRKNNDFEYEKIIKENNFSDRTLKLATALRDFIFLRTYTTECSDHIFYKARHSLFKEISQRCGIDNNDLIMLGINEIVDVLNNNCRITSEVLELIKSRKSAFSILWIDGDVSIYLNEEALTLQSEIGKVYKVNDNNIAENSDNIIKGMSANKGKVTGKAKVLLEYEDIFEVEKGDIIVATMTTPDYVAAMEKAIGFITDEGGITCHAAIISREFNVPCIVGTNNATSKIKSGQLIELDAYNGVITIIE